MPFDGAENPKVVLLERARCILHKRGWAQAGTYNLAGNVCIYGAIREAFGEMKRSSRFVWDDLGLGPFPAPFNDAPGRTLAEIDGWFDARIAEVTCVSLSRA